MKSIHTPFVSVVMTSYNREQYIVQAIDSILSQECDFPYEIIIGDDCSTDNSRCILNSYKEKYPEVFVLNLQETNRGFGINWASTCKLARGKYIAFLDDDDYWCDTHHMALMVDYFETHYECGLVYANRWVVNENFGTKILANAKIPYNEDKLHYILRKGLPILFSASMIRKSIMDKYVDLDAYIRLGFPIQDFPTAVLIAPYCEFHYIEKPTVVYRSYDGSMSRPKKYDAIVKKYFKEKVMVQYLYKQLGIEYDISEYDKHIYWILLGLAYKRGDYCKAKEFAKHTYNRNIKCLCAKTWFTFHGFRTMKKVVQYIDSTIR